MSCGSVLRRPTHACTKHGQAAGSHRLRHKKPRPFTSGRKILHVAAASEATDSPAATVKLGNSDLEVSRLGLGTIRWGDTSKGFGPMFDEEDLYGAFEAARVGGINLFDTAEVYGYQSLKDGSQAEQVVGRLARRAASLPLQSPPPVIASKYFTIPWTNALIGGGFRLGRQAMLDALAASLQRLQVDRLDLWQVHFPFPTYPQGVLASGLQEAYEKGLVRAVGVCNYNKQQVEQMHSLLAKSSIPLASNQVKYSILDRSAEKDGTLQACADLGVGVIAHSPLEQGLLTGRSLGKDETSGKEQQIKPLLQLMEFIGALSGGRTVTQVALNWLIAKGTIPIPGGKTGSQVKEHVGALGWSLDDNEVAMIEEKLDALKL